MIDNSLHFITNGTDLVRKDWVCLNRARAKVGRTGDNMRKWGLRDSASCPCGHHTQTFDHIQNTCPLGPRVSDEDLKEANEIAIEFVNVWCDTL